MRHKKTASLTAGQEQLEETKELADVLRSLHRLLLDYGPEWYNIETDDRVRKALLTRPCKQEVQGDFRQHLSLFVRR
jgi:hypothetical protein